ncbi:MAG: thioredoxin-dependent thiol peroxidase [Bacteroidetes bacterium]|nr:thioredoxin-dependent thiol peroxidase [Bacteroidota bacterium]
MLTAGSKAPLTIRVKDQDGKTVSLADYKGKTVVLYFYPKDDTPGCTKEACAFRDDQADLKAAGVQVIGVSGDDEKSHVKFIGKFNLNFPLWADVNNELSSAFGAWGEKSMYGRKYMGIHRVTFIIGPDGTILKAYPKVKPETHSQEILADLKSL